MTAVRSTWMLRMDFPERLTALRKARGLTLKALADAVGVHISQIQRYEAGQTQPNLDVIRKLAVALSVSADELVFDGAERGPDDALKLQFEALRQFDEDERMVAQELLDSLILKHQARQVTRRSQSAERDVKKRSSGSPV